MRETIEMQQLLMAAESLLREEAGEHIKLRYVMPAQPLYIAADGERFRQVLGWIGQQAAKHMPVDGLLVMRLAREGETAILEISDSGPGLREMALDCVKDPASKEDSLSAAIGSFCRATSSEVEYYPLLSGDRVKMAMRFPIAKPAEA